MRKEKSPLQAIVSAVDDLEDHNRRVTARSVYELVEDDNISEQDIEEALKTLRVQQPRHGRREGQR